MRHGRKRLGIATWIALLAIVLIIPSAQTTSAETSFLFPTVIEGDAALATHEYLSQGTGEEDNPFVIEDLDTEFPIYCTPLDQYVHFAVMNTTSYLLLRDIEIHSHHLEIPGGGVVLSNCSNVRIEEASIPGVGSSNLTLVVRNCTNVVISECHLEYQLFNSIMIENSTDVVIEKTSIIGGSSSVGILIRSSHNVQITDSFLQGISQGIRVERSSGVRVANTIMENVGYRFQDLNPAGENSYDDEGANFLWSDTKTVLTSAVVLVEVALVLSAVVVRKRSRGRVASPGNVPIELRTNEAAGGKQNV